jgi:hypothetical protein
MHWRVDGVADLVRARFFLVGLGRRRRRSRALDADAKRALLLAGAGSALVWERSYWLP